MFAGDVSKENKGIVTQINFILISIKKIKIKIQQQFSYITVIRYITWVIYKKRKNPEHKDMHHSHD